MLRSFFDRFYKVSEKKINSKTDLSVLGSEDNESDEQEPEEPDDIDSEDEIE